ncbi:class I SAM-dependent methyltransferase [Kitasatospora cineracea]|uniref:Putative SAM-dependent methyltransferase n=1 Tax=Kitasatospora cineracea TaxID=88074 RepID=A0A8G1UAX0_9ACTN|nr:methyltransferase domain-containing protein [Kitasatospora cineracea]ROR37377.1 putative SAM-dependent methyltransferase [Kitasatospora cineracea]
MTHTESPAPGTPAVNLSAPPATVTAPAAELFADWDWEDPDGLEARTDAFTDDLARCTSIELVRPEPPHTHQDFRELGVTGIEFAAFRTRHPQGLGTDLVGLHTDADTHADADADADAEGAVAATRPGPVYRIDGSSLYTRLDIGRPLPFADRSVDWVYAEHLIEHVPLGTAVAWLAEVRRVLRPGGLLRITTPDLAKYVTGYLDDREQFFRRHRRRLRTMRVGPPMPERRAFMLNQIFYHFGHRWIYDEAELRYVLDRAGYGAFTVVRREFQTGARPDVAALDTAFRKDESIYLEAVAPDAAPGGPH